MVADAEKFASEDHARREAAEARNAGDQLTYQVERSLEEWGDKVPESDREELKRLNEELKEALKGEDVQQIRSRTEAVMAKFQAIGQAMYQQPSEPAGQQAAGSDEGSSSPADDDVVEGEIVDEGGA
jgi:molecular chaperone DnaK